jgi:hypothetical protein
VPGEFGFGKLCDTMVERCDRTIEFGRGHAERRKLSSAHGNWAVDICSYSTHGSPLIRPPLRQLGLAHSQHCSSPSRTSVCAPVLTFTALNQAPDVWPLATDAYNTVGCKRNDETDAMTLRFFGPVSHSPSFGSLVEPPLTPQLPPAAQHV